MDPFFATYHDETRRDLCQSSFVAKSETVPKTNTQLFSAKYLDFCAVLKNFVRIAQLTAFMVNAWARPKCLFSFAIFPFSGGISTPVGPSASAYPRRVLRAWYALRTRS